MSNNQKSICPADNNVRITNISAALNTTNVKKPPVAPADTTNSTGLENSTEPTFSTDTKDFWEDTFILVIGIPSAFVILIASTGISLYIWRKYKRAASQNQSRKINVPIELITLPTNSNRVEEITLDQMVCANEPEIDKYMVPSSLPIKPQMVCADEPEKNTYMVPSSLPIKPKNNANFEEEEDHHYESIYVEMVDQTENNNDSDESLYVNMEFRTDEKGIVNVQL
ncbi:uncharacterized protein LOC129922573 [Biomphalaria glabrata]|uniref:Uncharacterized protein LOC129922573 n=1 Tax=Biomphalaria glabrata TaxID=6526 RepID=A0A9W2YR66_BIOGL|nr:uncharacterized protein LOC129922573 [Biomphalaria glabrata]